MKPQWGVNFFKFLLSVALSILAMFTLMNGCEFSPGVKWDSIFSRTLTPFTAKSINPIQNGNYFYF